jgi:hypothetical protein|tara:strand:- start:9719 stop:9892 length:174 start_codon:yes stop_codon:yes gene_type:complete
MEKFENLKSLVEGLNEDMEKFYDKSNKAAGTRVRQGLQEIKKVAQEIRLEISEKKKS